MKRSFLGLWLCTTLVGLCHAQTAAPGSDMNPDERQAAIRRAMSPDARIDAYKSRIDFDRKFAADDGRRMVVFDWSRLAREHLPGLAALKIDHYEQRLNESGPLKDIRVYIFDGAFNGARASITVAETKNRFQAADYFFGATTMTSTAEVLFESGPAQLGSVSVQSTVAGPGRGFVWIYRNLCFEVVGAPEDAVRDLSLGLQALAEAHTVNAQ